MDATVRLSGQNRRFPVKPGVRCGRSADPRSDTPFSLPWLRATAAAELGRLTPCGPRTTPTLRPPDVALVKSRRSARRPQGGPTTVHPYGSKAGVRAAPYLLRC